MGIVVVAGQARTGTSSKSGLDLGGLALKVARDRKVIPYITSFNASTLHLSIHMISVVTLFSPTKKCEFGSVGVVWEPSLNKKPLNKESDGYNYGAMVINADF